MKQTFVSKRRNSNGHKSFIILDTEKKTYQTGITGASALSWNKSELVISVASIKEVEEDLQYGNFEKI